MTSVTVDLFIDEGEMLIEAMKDISFKYGFCSFVHDNLKMEKNNG